MGVPRVLKFLGLAQIRTGLTGMNSLQMNISRCSFQTQDAVRMADAAKCENPVPLIAAQRERELRVYFAGGGFRVHFGAG